MLKFEQVVRREFLQARYLVLELASVLDRLDEAAAREALSPGDNPTVGQLARAVKMLAEPSAQANRVERLLRHYSGAET